MALRAAILLILAGLLAPSAAVANTSHAGWPAITGMLLMNKQDQARPLDGRPGSDPFDGADPEYSCDGLHLNAACISGGPTFTPASWDCPLRLSDLLDDITRACWQPRVRDNLVPADIGHNELLGGAGDNVIHAGPAGDVIWGYYKPSGAPTAQANQLFGGAGDDFIYAAHGSNVIHGGGGHDVIHAHFGHGAIWCESAATIVYLSRRSRPGYDLHGCRHLSYKTLGY